VPHKPNSVTAVSRGCGHLSRPAVTGRLKRPTRDFFSPDEPGRLVAGD